MFAFDPGGCCRDSSFWYSLLRQVALRGGSRLRARLRLPPGHPDPWHRSLVVEGEGTAIGAGAGLGVVPNR